MPQRDDDTVMLGDPGSVPRLDAPAGHRERTADDARLDDRFDDFLDSAEATEADHRSARIGTVWGIAAIPVAFVGLVLLAVWALPPLTLFLSLATAAR